MKPARRQRYTNQDLCNSLKFFNEIAFSQKDIISSECNEEHDFAIPTGKGDRFLLQKIQNDCFRITNASPLGHPLYVDYYCIEPGKTIDLVNQESVFIYDKKFSEESQEGPSFIYGFNPARQEIQELTPDDRGCSIKAENFTKKFKIGDDKFVGIENVSFEIRPAEFVGIYGNSGTGKTVLIESLLSPHDLKGKHTKKKEVTSGTLLIDKKRPKQLSNNIAYLPQHIQFPKQMKCRELLKQGYLDRRNAAAYNAENIQEVLQLCALSPDILNERCGRLSGGQQRRLALAMTLLNNKIRLIIADEPTSGLDIANELEIMRTLRCLSRSRGITVMVVTHAVAALHLFDRVMVLRKNSDDKGASLSFNSLWHDEMFPEIFRKNITQDAARIAFLSNKASALQLVKVEKTKYQWPFCFGEYLKIPPTKWQDKVKNTILAPIKWINETLSLQVFSQYIGWCKNTSRLIIRQRKSLLTFIVLAICCVISLQLGVVNGVSGDETFLSMMALCGPWLCATYATVFTSELLSAFAWENLAGLRARSFTFGILSGLILPTIIIAFIFTFGLFFRFDNDWLAKQNYNILKQCKAQKVISFFINEEEEKEYIKTTSKKEWKDNHSIKAIPPQYLISTSELGCHSQGDDVLKTDKETTYGEQNSNKNNIISPENFFIRQWIIMILISTIGTTLGVASIAFWRDVKSATIGLVILFIAFLVFSRTFITEQTYMYSMTTIPSGELGVYDMKWSIPIALSFLGIGRYTFNVLSYPLNGLYLLEWLPLLVWWILSVIIAMKSFANRTKNWRTISR